MEQKENIGPQHAIRLADLREWHVITAVCFKCGYQGRLTASYLAWDRPDRFASDFTLSSYREFEAYVRPLLDGARGNNVGDAAAAHDGTMPPLMAEADVTRGVAALRPRGFDPALAVRAVLTGLAASAPGASAGATDTRKSVVHPWVAADASCSARRSARDSPLSTTAGLRELVRSRETAGADGALHAASAAHSVPRMTARIRGAPPPRG